MMTAFFSFCEVSLDVQAMFIMVFYLERAKLQQRIINSDITKERNEQTTNPAE